MVLFLVGGGVRLPEALRSREELAGAILRCQHWQLRSEVQGLLAQSSQPRVVGALGNYQVGVGQVVDRCLQGAKLRP